MQKEMFAKIIDNRNNSIDHRLRDSIVIIAVAACCLIITTLSYYDWINALVTAALIETCFLGIFLFQIYKEKTAANDVKVKLIEILETGNNKNGIASASKLVMQAVNNADLPVIVLDDDNVIYYASKTAAKRLEHISEELVGRNLMGFVGAEDKHPLEANLHRMLRNCTDRLVMEINFICKSGILTKQMLVMNRFVNDGKWFAACFMIPDYLHCRLKA